MKDPRMTASATIPSASLHYAPLAALGISLSIAGLILLLLCGYDGAHLHAFSASTEMPSFAHAVDSLRTAPPVSAPSLATGIALTLIIALYGYAFVLLFRRRIPSAHENAQDLLHAKYVLTVAQRVAHVGSWELDGATQEMQCSDELFRICGLEPQSVKPTLQFMLGLIHPADREAATAAIIATRDEGKEFRIQNRIVRPDGSIRHVVSVGEATRDKNGWVLKAIGALLDITEQKEAELALRQSQDQLRRLAAHQEHVREEERKHIARELHDELGSVLTGIKACLSVATERTTKGTVPIDSLLLEASDLTDQASGTMRKMITELRPSILDQLGVWDALHWIARQTENCGTLRCECIFTDAATTTPIDSDSSIALFRIAQEALTNVVRHAEASRVTICADRHGDSITLEIADNGKGNAMYNSPAATGWGIIGMQERARHLGGEFTLAGMPGKGTVASLHLPIHSSVQVQP